MKKELKYNIILAIVLIVMNLLWNNLSSNKDSYYQFRYPFFILTFTFNICFYGIYALNYLFFAPKLLAKKKLFLYVFSFVVMIFIFAGARFLLEEIIYFNLTGHHNYGFNDTLFNRYMFDSFYYTLRACLYSSIVYLLFQFIKNKDKIHQLEIENKQAQLLALKSQISPHFLFNTLNSFYSELFDTKPETANDILKLSELLRYVTYESTEDFMPLNKEITFIKDYLYFYKKRYETNFYVNFKIVGKVSNQQIPSLLLINFVENLCKHGIINDTNNPAEIRILIGKEDIQIKTSNKINSGDRYMDSGIGTVNIQKRLDVLFPNNYSLDITKTDTQYNSYLKIPL